MAATTRLPAQQPQQQLSTALAATVNELDSIAKSCRALAFPSDAGHVGQFARALATADGIRSLRRALSAQIMEVIMDLQGTGLGFKTDKDSTGGYPVEVVRECLIEATLRGAMPVNNEWNIISSRPYLSLNYFKRALREYPGLTDLNLMPGVPYLVGTSGALVDYRATWKLQQPDGQVLDMRLDRTKLQTPYGEVDQRIPVRVNSGQGADAILGKAERKMRAAILAKITGTDFSEGEVEESQLGLPAPTMPPAGHGSLRGNGPGQPTATMTINPGDGKPYNPDPPPSVEPEDTRTPTEKILTQAVANAEQAKQAQDQMALQDFVDDVTDKINAADRSVEIDRIRARIKETELPEGIHNDLLKRCDEKNASFAPAPAAAPTGQKKRRDF